MATIAEWVDDIAREFPEALETVIARCVRYAVQDFFKLSEAWRHTETITLAPGVTEYAFLSLPDETYAISASYGYITTSAHGRRKMQYTLAHRFNPEQSTEPTRFSINRTQVMLEGEVVDGTIEVSLVMQPTRNVTEVTDEVADSWYDDIRKGAMAQLLVLPDKPWSDPRQAGILDNLMREAAQRARREARDDRSRPKRSVKFNSGFRW